MSAELRALIAPIRCFLLDMDGTFYLGDRLLPGALEFLDAVRGSGRSFLFLTNNSSKSAAQYVQKLARLGAKVEYDQVLTSGQATGRYLLEARPGQRAYLLGNAALRAELSEMGVPLDDARPDYVLVGYDTSLTYERLTRACDLLREGLPYIATHPDINCPTERGFAPDIGAFMACIRASTGRDADVIIGKPHRGIVDAALARTGLPAAAHAMVGDRLYTDVRTGLDHGMLSVLVFSGETTREMLAASDIRPHMALELLRDICALL